METPLPVLSIPIGKHQLTVNRRYVDMAMLIALRCCLLLMQLVFQVLLARFFGAAPMGAVQIFISYTTTLGEACLLGKPASLMRQLSKTNTQSHTANSIIRFWLFSLAWTLFAIGFMSVIAVVLLRVKPTLATNFSEWLWAMPWALLGYCTLRCSSESLKAIGKVKIALCLEVGALPVIMLCSLLVLSADDIALFINLYAGAFIATGAMLATTFIYVCKRHFSGATNIEASIHNQWKSLWFSGMLGIAYGQFAILALPYFATLESVGLNSAALRYIALTTTLLMVLASYFSPKFATADSDPKKLQSLLKQSQLVSVVLFTPFALVFLLAPTHLLGLFGNEFEQAKPVLQMLAIAQLINAGTGIPGVLLKMAGKAAWEQNILIICLLFATLSLCFIGAYNAGFGVMIVFCGLIIIKNCLSYIAAQKLIAQLTPQGVETHV